MTDDAARADRLRRMLEAGSVAVVGASERSGSFGLRLATEALRSPGVARVHLVHPHRRTVLGRPCLPTLDDVPEPVDVVLLGVPDAAVPEAVRTARRRGDGGVVVFGPAAGLAAQIVDAAADLPVCGPSCMGFVNVSRGVRAIGYLERDPLPAGGIVLVSHSGSVFSALLRTSRRLDFSLVVSSGQELVTTAADYLDFAVEQPETRVVALFLEAMRDVPRLRSALARAADRDLPVVALTVGSSTAGRRLVEAHSGAVAGADAAWEALCTSYGVHRVHGLDELLDTVETFAIGRRPRRRSTADPGRFASMHDSGAERVLVADVAARVGVGFADLSPATSERLRGLLGPGLAPDNPLDVWSTGADTERLATDCLTALADDPAVEAVALAVDLVEEYDGDDAYPKAVLTAIDRTTKPVVVLSNVASAVDRSCAALLRARGVPVLEGTRSGLVAIGHLLAPAPAGRVAPAPVDEGRRQRWRRALRSGALDLGSALALLADYGVSTAPTARATSAEEAVAAAEAVGYPVVLKTDERRVSHRSAVDGVRLALDCAVEVEAAYDALAGRLGPAVAVQPQLTATAEVYLGLHADPVVGTILLVAPGGADVERTDGRRAAALPPVGRDLAERLLRRVIAEADVGQVRDLVQAVLALSQLAVELGDDLAAVDVNPLLLTAAGGVAVDALLLGRPAAGAS